MLSNMSFISDFSISHAARQLGVNPGSIRMWERAGLLPFRPRRNLVGRRVFSIDEIETLREFLKERHGKAGSK